MLEFELKRKQNGIQLRSVSKAKAGDSNRTFSWKIENEKKKNEKKNNNNNNKGLLSYDHFDERLEVEILLIRVKYWHKRVDEPGYFPTKILIGRRHIR